MASAGFMIFDVPERDFPGNRSPARWSFVDRPKGKICAPGEGLASIDDMALTASIQSVKHRPAWVSGDSSHFPNTRSRRRAAGTDVTQPRIAPGSSRLQRYK